MMFKQSLIDFIHRAAVCNFKLIVALILDILHMAADTGADTGRNLGGCDIYQVIPDTLALPGGDGNAGIRHE